MIEIFFVVYPLLSPCSDQIGFQSRRESFFDFNLPNNLCSNLLLNWYLSPILFIFNIWLQSTIISSVPYNNLPYSLVSSYIKKWFLESGCIRGVVYLRLNFWISSDLIATYNSYLILSETDPGGVCLIWYVRGLKLFTLRDLFIDQNITLSVHIAQYVLSSYTFTCNSI